MKKTMIRPCDCKDQVTADRLEYQGFSTGDRSISIEPNSVVIRLGNLTNPTALIRIPMSTFKLFAEWYLEEQEIKQ